MLPTPRDFLAAFGILAFCAALVLLACLLASIGADPEVHNYV